MYKDYLKKVFEVTEQSVLTCGNRTETDYEEIMKFLVELFSSYKTSGGCLFIIGNGGSSAIASHMTADFMKNGGMKTYSLYDNAVTTCMGNDYGYEHVFSKPLSFLGRKEDLLVAISSSGMSQNIVNAIDVAHENEMKVLTFTGFDEGNTVREKGDYNLYVPMKEYGILETAHIMILQQIVDEIYHRDGAIL